MEQKLTLAQAKQQQHEAIEANRDLGVISYRTKAKQSDRIYEVVEGKHHAGGRVLGPGQRFHPTEEQIETGSLEGKARELTNSEYRDARRDVRGFAGADIGLRALPMAEQALKLAFEAQLTEEDFANVQPAGRDGRYTKAQVEELAAARRARS